MTSPIEWTSEKVNFLQKDWINGLVTSEIARRLSLVFDENFSKNMVVGKKKRLAKWDPAAWPDRPTPICRSPDGTPAPSHKAKPRAPSTALPPLPCLKERPFVDSAPPPPPVRAAPKAVSVAVVLSLLRSEMRDPNLPLRRRDGSGCYRILGDDKSEWRVCDAPLYDLQKPYCRECRDLCTARASVLVEEDRFFGREPAEA